MIDLATPLKEKIPKIIVKKQELLVVLSVVFFGFFMGRAAIFDFLNPFSVAFLCAALISNSYVAVASLSILLGSYSYGSPEMLLRQLVITAILIIFYLLLRKTRIKKKVLFCILGMVISFITGFFIFYVNNYYLYDLLMLIMESIMICALININNIGYPLLTGFGKRTVFSMEEMVSMTILTASLFLGSSLKIWVLSLNKIFSVFLILLISFGGNIGAAAITGTAVGVLQSLSGDIYPSAIGIYSLCGLISAALKKCGKPVMVIGFIFTNAFMTFYINGSTEVLISKNEIIFASLLFLLISEKYLKSFFSFVSAGSNKKTINEKSKDYAAGRLMEISDVFKELAVSLNISQKSDSYFSQLDAASIIENTAKDVCYSCGMYDNCWKTGFLRTYERMFNLLSAVESGKELKFEDKEPVIEKCIFPTKVFESLRFNYNVNKSNRLWRKKLDEGRVAYSHQMSETSKLIEDLAKKLGSSIEFNTDTEGQIAAALDSIGIRVKGISAVMYKNSMEIDLKVKFCGGKRDCMDKILPVIKEVTGKSFFKADLSCRITNNDICNLKFRESLKFSSFTGFAKRQKDNSSISGDNFSFIETGDGKFFMILSDGMGSGYRASMESGIAVSLLEKFLHAGYDQSTSLETINSLLLIKSNEDNYATLDISMINQYTGEIEFLKVGAVSTFIKYDNRVEIIKNSSLPVGILNKVDIGFNRKKLKEGDFIIMVTDGALEANKKEIDKENWLADIIEEINIRSPQKLAEHILERCLAESGGKAADDITVLVTKLWRSSK